MEVAPLGRPTSLLLDLAVVLLLLIVLPVLESLMFPELSIILVLDPVELLLPTAELLEVDALLL